MKSVALNAFPRTAHGRGEVKKLRAGGRVPAVIYGRQNKPQNLELNTRDLENLIHHSASENVLVDLTLPENSRRLALVQAVQHHPLTGQFVHVDLHEVAENEHVTVMISVESTGEAKGVKTGGGVLEHVLFKVKARALPKDLPEVLTVDVSNLDIGQSIHIGDIKPPEGVEILGDPKVVVLSVAAPITEAAEAAAAAAAPGAATAEVEMIKEKKEEGAAPAKGAPAAAKAGDKAAADKGGDKKAEKKK